MLQNLKKKEIQKLISQLEKLYLLSYSCKFEVLLLFEGTSTLCSVEFLKPWSADHPKNSLALCQRLEDSSCYKKPTCMLPVIVSPSHIVNLSSRYMTVCFQCVARDFGPPKYTTTREGCTKAPCIGYNYFKYLSSYFYKTIKSQESFVREKTAKQPRKTRTRHIRDIYLVTDVGCLA